MTHFLQRTALIALASGALGACASDDALQPRYPTRAPETPPTAAEAPAPVKPAEPAPAASEPPGAAAPTPPVEERPLAPLPPARPPAAQAAPEAAPPSPAPTRAPPPAPAYRTVTTRSVTGRVVAVEGRAVTYRVKKGDTLEEIADKLGTSVSALRDDNGLKKRAKIHPGQVLKGPRAEARAYVAGPGDTLYSIARRFGVTADAIREESGLSSRAALHAGEKVRLPEGYHDRGPLTSTTRVPVSAAPPPAAADETAAAPEPDAPAGPPQRAGESEVSPPVAPGVVPTYRSVTTRSVTGRVVEVEGAAESYRVKRGDSLEKVARKLDTTVDELREDNDLGRHEKIRPGQVLKGPRATARAYVVEGGDTLYSIARRFGVTPEALRAENGLSRNAGLHTGEKLRLPAGYHDHGPLTSTSRVLVNPQALQAQPAPSAPAAAPPRAPAAPSTFPTPSTFPAPSAVPPPAPRPYTPPVRPYSPPPYSPPPAPRTYAPPPISTGPVAAPSAAPTPADEQISQLGRGRFVWPLQGPIVSDFGAKPTGQRNDGVNIGAAVGAPVRAAAAGDVVYAGDQVPGFGNLVLIKHADGWVTAYGHLSRVLVKMQQKVAQGQEIGQAGATGGVSEPQLHFEIRYAPSPLERAKPVDPKLVLPK